MEKQIELGKKSMIAAMVVTAMISSGCGRQDVEIEKEVDLSESEDMFDAEASQTQTNISADTVVATVNGDDILFSQVQREVESALAAAPSLPPSDALQEQLPALLSRSLENVITRKLVRGAVKEEEVSVPESEVVKRLRQINSKIEGDKKLTEVLAEQGMSLDEFRAKLTEEMEAKKLVEIHTAEVQEPTEEEIEDYYEANSNKFIRPQTAGADDTESADDREESEVISLEEAKGQIKTYLQQKGRQDALSRYINKLEERAEIEIHRDLENIDIEIGQAVPGKLQNAEINSNSSQD